MFKKIFLISLLLGSIILTGCSEENWLSKDELFEKKKECSMLSDQVMKEIEFQYWKIDNWFTENGLQIENPEVFYSKKLNSCIYKSEIIKKFDSKDISANYFLKLVDFFNKKEIIEVSCDFKTSDQTSVSWIPQHSSKDMQEFSLCTEPFHNKLDELKWE